MVNAWSSLNLLYWFTTAPWKGKVDTSVTEPVCLRDRAACVGGLHPRSPKGEGQEQRADLAAEREAVCQAVPVLRAVHLHSSRGERGTRRHWWDYYLFPLPWVGSKNQYLPTPVPCLLCNPYLTSLWSYRTIFLFLFYLRSEKQAAQCSWGQLSMPQYENTRSHCNYPGT